MYYGARAHIFCTSVLVGIPAAFNFSQLQCSAFHPLDTGKATSQSHNSLITGRLDVFWEKRVVGDRRGDGIGNTEKLHASISVYKIKLEEGIVCKCEVTYSSPSALHQIQKSNTWKLVVGN